MSEQQKPSVEPIGKLLSDVIPEGVSEVTYRRAYRDGWVAAVHGMADLMFQVGCSRNEAIQKSYNFWGSDLSEWFQKAVIAKPDNHLELPPKIKIKRGQQ